MIKNFVINIKAAENRRKHIVNMFDLNEKIAFELFEAVTPENLDETIEIIMPSLKYNQQLSLGEKSCLMSHASLWKKCIDERIAYMAIFEDDVVLGRRAHFFLKDSEWIESRFANDAVIIRLETFLTKSNLKKTKIPSKENCQFFKLESIALGSAAYIISYHAAEILLAELRSVNNHETYKVKSADWILFDNMLRRKDIAVYQVFPAVCIQDQRLQVNNGLGSDMEFERSVYHKANQHLLKRKTLKEFIEYHIIKLPLRKYRKLRRKKVPFDN